MISIETDNILFKIKSLNKSIVNSLFNGQIVFIPPTQVEIIEYILNSKSEKIYQKDLENVLHSRRATISSVLMTMEKNSLIRRVTDNNDLRSKQIILNDSAKEIFLNAKKRIIEINNILTKDLTNDEIELFLDMINKMKNNIESYNK